jgi:pyroglutamyl-peptidase
MAVLQPSVPSLPIPMMLVALRVMIRTVVAE